MRAIEIDDEDMQNIEEPDCVDIEEAVSLREIKSLQLSLAGSSEDTQLGKLFWKIDVKKDNETYQIQRTYSYFEWLLNALRKNEFVFMPTLDKNDLTTYIKTKMFVDQKILKWRGDTLQRFVHRLQSNKYVIKTKYLQIFIEPNREKFTMLQNFNNQNSNSEPKSLTYMVGSYFEKGKDMILRDGSKYLIYKYYKEKFTDIYELLDAVTTQFEVILDSHSEYLKALKEYAVNLSTCDEEYNQYLYRLKHGLLVLREYLKEHVQEGQKYRNKAATQKYKDHFEYGLMKYKEDLKEEISAICMRLSDLNVRSSKAIQQLFNYKFIVQI